jgi:hypothetical protein
LLSTPQRAPQLYRKESLYPLGHPVSAAMLETAIKETQWHRYQWFAMPESTASAAEKLGIGGGPGATKQANVTVLEKINRPCSMFYVNNNHHKPSAQFLIKNFMQYIFNRLKSSGYFITITFNIKKILRCSHKMRSCVLFGCQNQPPL